jgi:hypothetical protein
MFSRSVKSCVYGKWFNDFIGVPQSNQEESYVFSGPFLLLRSLYIRCYEMKITKRKIPFSVPAAQ